MSRSFRIPFPILTAAFVLTLAFDPLFAQNGEPSPSPSASPVSEEEAELDEDIRLLEKKKAKIKLQSEIRGLVVPSDVTPLEGSVSGTKDMFIEVEMQSYRAARVVTNRIACDVKGVIPKPGAVILHRSEDYDQWRNYKLVNPVVDDQLKDIETRYDAFLASPGNASPSLIPGLGVIADITGAVKAFAGLVAFLRTETSFDAKSVDINEAALRGSIGRSLKVVFPSTDSSVCSDVNVKSAPAFYDPSLFSPSVSATGAFSSKLLDKIRALYVRKAQADAAIRLYDVLLAEIEEAKTKESKAKEEFSQRKALIETHPALIAGIDAEIKKEKDPEKRKALIAARDKANKELAKAKLDLPDLETDYKDLKKDREDLESQLTDQLKIKIAGLRRTNTEFSEFLATVTKPNETTGISPLSQYVRAENLDDVLAKYDAYWLQIKPAKAGGNNRVKKNLVRYIFGPDISHSGGVIVQYMLANENGEVVLSNAESHYERYANARSIQK